MPSQPQMQRPLGGRLTGFKGPAPETTAPPHHLPVIIKIRCPVGMGVFRKREAFTWLARG